MANTFVGISGWRYQPWRRVFYPADLAQHRELAFAERAFPSIEINGSFYSLQSPASYQAWYAATPPGFVFSVKGPRYVTHILRLRNALKPLANFFASGIFNLREKLGPMLWQFPPSLRYDPRLFSDRPPRKGRSRDVFCYFDNDIKVRAPFDTDRLMQKLGVERRDNSFRFPPRSALRNTRAAPPLPPFRWRPANSRAAKS